MKLKRWVISAVLEEKIGVLMAKNQGFMRHDYSLRVTMVIMDNHPDAIHVARVRNGFFFIEQTRAI